MQNKRKSSPRDIFVVCSYSDEGGSLIVETIQVRNTTEATKDSMFAEATREFQRMHAVVPKELSGPFYEWKGSQTIQTKKEEIDVSDWEYVPNKKAVAIFNGWQVSVRFFQNHDDYGFVFFKDSIVSNRKTKPASRPVRISELSNLTYIEGNNE